MALPGFGIFTLDKSVVLPEENDRALLALPNAVQFQNANIAAADKELISFICENTGKIKPLAIADLDSYLNLGGEMLNIGKHFYLDGIGTITKNKLGKFDFTPGEYTLIKENAGSGDYGKKRLLVNDKVKVNMPSVIQDRNLLKVFALVAALAIVGWGGYLMYKKNSTVTSITPESTPAVAEPKTVAPDTAAVLQPSQDTGKVSAPVTSRPVPSVAEGDVYKWVILATADKPYALRRYHQLVSFDLKAFLNQKDTNLFKVYFQFPARTKDTLRIKDSLKRQYAHDVSIEH